jgi:hypothetical protein
VVEKKAAQQVFQIVRLRHRETEFFHQGLQELLRQLLTVEADGVV